MNATLSLVDEVVAAVLVQRRFLEVIPSQLVGASDPGMEGRRPRPSMVRVRNGAGDRVVRIFSQDPEVDVSIQVESWNGLLHASASFQSMPADVIASAVVAALELEF